VKSEPKSVGAHLREAVAARRLEFDPAQEAAAARLDSLADRLRRKPPALLETLRSRLARPARAAVPPAPRGLYLWGGVGRGKTLLMDAFVGTLEPLSHERTHFYRFMRGVHEELARFKGHARPLDLVAQGIAERVRVLCLDEFLVADIADAMLLAGLLEGLLRRDVALVATSNVAPRDLYKDGLQRQRFVPAIELIESLDVLHLDGASDYRLRALEQAPTYLDARAPQTPASLAQRFAALTGGAPSAPRTLIIEGRPLRAVATGPDVAWFEFSELCEGPRSQNDYIDIARLYGTLIIANIPRFTPQDEDAARRFIMLIDELYDRGVKLVVSAAAAPAELYQGERLQFEFPRAASRLVEMQTQQYLAGRHHA
jgi:cell division protein ZapE